VKNLREWFSVDYKQHVSNSSLSLWCSLLRCKYWTERHTDRIIADDTALHFATVRSSTCIGARIRDWLLSTIRPSEIISSIIMCTRSMFSSNCWILSRIYVPVHLINLNVTSRVPQCIAMQPFSNSSKLLTTSCSHKTFMMTSQTVQQSSR